VNTPEVLEKSDPSIENDNPVRVDVTLICPVETVHVGCVTV
jgi:hypothetical protein